MKNSLTNTRWTGRSSSSASADPSENRRRESARGLGEASQSEADSIVVQLDAMRLETVRDGADAVHLRESGGLQPVRERRSSAARSASWWTTTRRARRCWPKRCATRSRTARSRCATPSPRCIPAPPTDHVQVTNGGSEANYITTWNLVEPGDEVVMMVPNYMQTWGLARAFGGDVTRMAAGRSAERRRAGGVDVDALEAARHARATKLIIICNPNNPTGARIDAADLDRIAAVAGAARRLDAVGRDLPRRRARRTRNAVDVGPLRSRDRHERAVEGLRAAGPAHRLDRRAAGARRQLWSYHDYTTISPGALSDALARRALEPERRRADSRADARDSQRELPDHRGVARRPRRPVHLRAARRRRDRLRALRARASIRPSS